MDFSNKHGPPELLMKLALARVDSSPFSTESISNLKDETIGILEEHGLRMERNSIDHSDIPIDYRYMGLLLKAAKDPDAGLGDFAAGVRVGPGARLPRVPALYPPKRKWRLPKQMDPIDYLEEQSTSESVWRQNYSSLEEYEEQVPEVMIDQAKRGQVLRLSESDARKRFPGVVIASLGAQRTEKPGGVDTARVFFDGTHGIAVNHRTRVRDQERGPIAADIKRLMRGKSKTSEPTFALTADVTEAHRQIPIVEQDWHLLGCQVQPGGEVFVNTVGTFGVALLLVQSRVSDRAPVSARTWHLLVADDYHLDAGGPQLQEVHLCSSCCAAFLVPCHEKDFRWRHGVVGRGSNYFTDHTRLACPREGRNGFRNGPVGSQIPATHMCKVSKKASAV